jgi:uncharacterized protein YjbI with pentapeptide repeats
MNGVARPRIEIDDLRVDDLDGLADHDELEGALVDGVDLTGVEVRGLAVARSRLVDVRLSGATLERLDLVDVELDGCDLSGADLSGARLTRVAFRRCRMDGLVAPEVRAEHVGIHDAPMTEAWLRSSSWDRCRLEGCDLTAADLHGSRWTASVLRRCRLDAAELSTASFEGVALHGSTFLDLRGAAALRGCTIGPEQVLDLAGPALAALGVEVADDDEDPSA